MTYHHFGKVPIRFQKGSVTDTVWHMEENGTVWTGWMFSTSSTLTKEELLFILSTSLADLLETFPELRSAKFDKKGGLIQKS